ncbi:MAG: hypothetical protein LBS69_08195 [Prevotellaceae bacterium]|nr:hypothetical protein [Prevotellaceae bacterium]
MVKHDEVNIICVHYKVTTIVSPFYGEQTERLMTKIIERPALISKLLNRELDTAILQIAKSWD